MTAELSSEPEPGTFDAGDPANVSPLVAYLATEGCPLHGQVFFVWGGRVQLMQPWSMHDHIDADGRWTIAGLREAFAAEPAPARVTVGVASLPLGARIEIDAIALAD